MDETLGQIIERMPEWAAASDIATVALSGGISNQNYRVTVRGESFVVRVCGKDTELLGVDRNHEYAANVMAAETGVAPEVVAYFPDLGSLVTRFIDSQKMPPAVIGTPENLARVARAIGRLHAARPFPGEFSPFRASEAYRQTAAELGANLPATARCDEYFAQLYSIESALYGKQKRSAILRSCHNDLLNENLLDDGTVRIIDYEYAAMGDPFFDLGNFAAHHELTDEQIRLLASAYVAAGGQISAASANAASDFARIKLLMLASDLREALWSMVQTRVSTIDFDYQAYADRHFDRFAKAWNDPRVPAWLAQVTETRKQFATENANYK